MNTVEVKNIDGTYNLYNSNGDAVGRVCTDTGKAMIGNAFYDKVRVCHDVSDSKGFEPMMFKCSECGCEFDVETWYLGNASEDDWVEPTMWVDGKASYPKYCPNCKSKIID